MDKQGQENKTTLTFKEWVQRTFTDHEGMPSFKRQLAFMCFMLLILTIFIKSPVEVVELICWVMVGLVSVTGVEKFSNRKL